MSLSPKPLLHRLCFNELPRIYTFRVPTRYHLQKSKSPSSNLSHFRRLCSVTGDNNVRFLVHRILTKKFMTMKVQGKGMKRVDRQLRMKFKEIWDFWNIILWAFEYCLLPYNLSSGVVSEATFYKNHLVHVSFNVHETPECNKVESSVLFGIVVSMGSQSLTSFSTPSMLFGKLVLHWLARLYVAPAPGKMGYFAAAERFLKVMAMVWAGSQVTKLVRAGGALALAPFVDRGLSWFTGKFKFKSQEKVEHILSEAKELHDFSKMKLPHIGINLPVRNLLLSLIQKRFLKTSSTTRPPNAPSSPSSSSFTVQYLINSCGLPLQTALSVSKKFQIDENNLQKAQSAIQFLKSHGFQDTHIAKMIEKWPAVLRSKTEGTLKPKFDFLKKFGFVGPLLPQLAVLNPMIFKTSLDAHIKPCFELLKPFLESNEKILAALRRCPFLMSFSFNGTLRPNIDLLKKEGVPVDRVAKLLLSQPRSLQHSNDRIVYAVNYLKQLGIGPDKKMYIHALAVITGMSESAWGKKIDVFKSVGWTEEEVLGVFKRFPCLLLSSEEKIRGMMDFFLNKMKLERQTIVANPVLLKLSFSNRVLPRCNVLKVLKSKKLIKGEKNVATFLKLSEKDFMERCVTKYEDKVPGLLEMYGGADKGKR
uniref:Uncharacterized protein n=1 Tax=Salix viminalis TaxID=40686 RepID=A0A6N2K9C1_SALVM